MKAHLECNSLVCGYDKPLFSPVSFTLASGQSIALMGRSGIGKTTLLVTLLGMHRPMAGSVVIDGTDVHSLRFNELAKLRSTTIGTVFQSGELMSRYSALDNVMLPRLLWNRKDSDVKGEARELLDFLSVNPLTLAFNLSGGERQRVALARALINKPKLILADEPTGALDTEMRDEVTELLFTTIAQRGCSLLLVTHDQSVADHADRIVSLQPAQ